MIKRVIKVIKLYGLLLFFVISNINEKRVNIKILKIINLNVILFCIYSFFLWSVYYIDVNLVNIKFMKLLIVVRSIDILN